MCIRMCLLVVAVVVELGTAFLELAVSAASPMASVQNIKQLSHCLYKYEKAYAMQIIKGSKSVYVILVV